MESNEAPLDVEVDFPDADEYSVRVYDMNRERRLVAAIELVSPVPAWHEPLSVGAPLPTLPLWLAPELSLPLELDASYEETCRILRMA